MLMLMLMLMVLVLALVLVLSSEAAVPPALPDLSGQRAGRE